MNVTPQIDRDIISKRCSFRIFRWARHRCEPAPRQYGAMQETLPQSHLVKLRLSDTSEMKRLEKTGRMGITFLAQVMLSKVSKCFCGTKMRLVHV